MRRKKCEAFLLVYYIDIISNNMSETEHNVKHVQGVPKNPKTAGVAYC